MKTAHAIYECRLCKATFAALLWDDKTADTDHPNPLQGARGGLIRNHDCRPEGPKGIGIADAMGMIETDQPMDTPAAILKALEAVRYGH